MKREILIELLRIAGYHRDTKTFVRLYVENRISRTKATEEFNRGHELRLRGVRCTCRECRSPQ